MLELAHSITSGRTPAGSPVFFRVADDVRVDGHTVIRKGTLVEGRMQAVGDRGMVGASGSINFGVRYVPAVDGQNVRVLASIANQGRSRDGAVLGWVFMWGIFGLTTKGVDAYALRGAQLEAEVLTDRTVKSAALPADSPTLAAARSVPVAATRIGKRKVSEISFDLERVSALQPLVFDLPESSSIESATLANVNGNHPVQTVTARVVGETSLEFDLWDVIKYCEDGDNQVRLRIVQVNGELLDATAALRVKLKRK